MLSVFLNEGVKCGVEIGGCCGSFSMKVWYKGWSWQYTYCPLVLPCDTLVAEATAADSDLCCVALRTFLLGRGGGLLVSLVRIKHTIYTNGIAQLLI